MKIPLSTLFLVLPYLVSEVAALPSLRRPRAHKRAGGDVSHEWDEHAPYVGEAVSQEASAASVPASVPASVAASDVPSASVSGSTVVDPSFTGIPVASESLNPSDYLPFTETARTLEPLSNVPSASISSVLAETSKFSTFTYTDYQPVTETVWATETQMAEAPAATAADPAPTGDKDRVNKGLLRQAIGSIEEYANSLIGKVMPTLTLEVVLEPTQVSTLRAQTMKERFTDGSAPRWTLGLCRTDWFRRHCDRYADLRDLHRCSAHR